MNDSLSFCVSVHDMDEHGTIRPSALWRMMQDAAEWQMKCVGMDAQTMLQETGRAFLLSRARMQIYADVSPFDTVVARSWACDSRGYSFLRNGCVLRGDTVIAELSTVWAWMDFSAGRMVPVSEFDTDKFVIGEPLALDVPFRSSQPKDLSMSLVGEHTVAFRDVDLHAHMNNSVYPDVLRGFVPNVGNAKLSSVTIFFQNEAPLGQTLKVYSGEADGVHFLRTVREDGQENVRAEFQFD